MEHSRAYFYRRIIEPAIELSNHHLHEAKVDYATHFIQANLIGCRMIFGGISAVFHALCPFACRRTASNVCRQIVEEIDNPDVDDIDDIDDIDDTHDKSE